jgi:hypothetical protein
MTARPVHELSGGRRVRRGLVATMVVVAGVVVVGVAPAHALTPASCTEADLETTIATANGNGAGTPDTIFFPTGCPVFTLATGGPNGLPLITSPITIQGPGTIERGSGAPAFRIFEVAPGGSLTVNGVTLKDGLAPGNGGAILNNGTLRVQNCSFEGNSTRAGDNGAATPGVFGASGGLGIPGASVTSLTGADGSASGSGGAIFSVATSSLTVQGCTFLRNTTGAGGAGGASGPAFGGSGGAGGVGGESGRGGAVTLTAASSITVSSFIGNATGRGGRGGAGGTGGTAFGGAGGTGGSGGASAAGGSGGSGAAGRGGQGGTGGKGGNGGGLASGNLTLSTSMFTQNQAGIGGDGGSGGTSFGGLGGSGGSGGAGIGAGSGGSGAPAEPAAGIRPSPGREGPAAPAGRAVVTPP